MLHVRTHTHTCMATYIRRTQIRTGRYIQTHDDARTCTLTPPPTYRRAHVCTGLRRPRHFARVVGHRPLGSLLGPLGVLSGTPCGGRLEAFGGLVWHSRGPLGGLLAVSEFLLGRRSWNLKSNSQSWAPLGALLCRLLASGLVLGLSWAVLGPSSPSWADRQDSEYAKIVRFP